MLPNPDPHPCMHCQLAWTRAIGAGATAGGVYFFGGFLMGAGFLAGFLPATLLPPACSEFVDGVLTESLSAVTHRAFGHDDPF